MSIDALLAALKTATAAGDVEAAWMLRFLVTSVPPSTL